MGPAGNTNTHLFPINMMTMVFMILQSTDNMHDPNDEINETDDQGEHILPPVTSIAISDAAIDSIQKHDTGRAPDIEQSSPMPLIHEPVVLLYAGPFEITA